MSQIFKTPVDKQILFDFLDKVALKTENKYVLSNASYKKAHLNESLQPFIDSVEPYYHISKKYYTTRKPSYKMLATIIRQICRLNNIYYKQNIIYAKSDYEIIYFIYYKQDQQ
tara:strand:- start:3364 stop:3702 length:339 start_codon:yes stop_codon:yes gene_type:complete